jgi:GST-like protein
MIYRESGSILLYLAEKYNELIPPENDTKNRVQCINWLLWASSGLSVQCKLFGFYYKYCPHRLPYCITRYENEVRRLLGVLETQLAKHQKHWVLGDQFSIADLAIWPWIYALHENYDNCIQDVFGELKEFPLVKEYYTRCMSRPASRRALDVTRFID